MEWLPGDPVEWLDVVTFVSWLGAVAGGDDRLRKFYEGHLRAEFRPAFDAWVATRPAVNAGAPSLPFVMPEYRLAADAEVARCDIAAVRAAEDARHANAVSDSYMLATVMFALVLFFASTVHDVKSGDVRITLLPIAVLATAVGFVHLARLPPG